MGKALAASAAGSFRVSYPNIKLAFLVGICGAVPALSATDDEVILGDVMISDGIVQHDLQRQFPDRSERKDKLLDVLGRPNAEIRALLAKRKGGRSPKRLMDKAVNNLKAIKRKPALRAEYPGSQYDQRFEPTYHHPDSARTCEECGCDGPMGFSRILLDEDIPLPAIHFGLIASGDTAMKSREDRDIIAQRENIIAFEMEVAGLWDVFPCVVIKGAADGNI